MLFLSRGGAPVVLNKLDYRPLSPLTAPTATRPTTSPATQPVLSPAAVAAAARTPDYPWNQRPRDAANLTHFIGRSTENFLNWQVVNLSATAEQLLDAPILYVSGNKPLKLSPGDEQKLREFVLRGGLILGNADCPLEQNDPFVVSFVELGTRLFGYKFRYLEEGHVIYTNQAFRVSRWKQRAPVAGLSNGVREFMLLLPSGDPARAWQAN